MALLLLFESWVTVGLVLLALRIVYLYFTRTPLPDLPWSGTSNRPFSKTYARIRCVYDHQACLNHAYETYSKKGQACILPNLLGDQVLIPSDSVDWIVNQPEELLNAFEPQKDGLQADYTMGPMQLSQNPTHLPLVKRDLTRHIGSITGDLIEEVALCFEEFWGVDTEEWKEIPLVDDMRRLISRVSSRIFVGLPHCRNESYLKNTIRYANAIPLSSFAIKLVPNILRPILARVIAAPNNYYLWRTAQSIKPTIKERMEALDRKERDPEFKYEPPNDLLQWAIKYGRESKFSGECTPKMLAGRILVVNFASIHTSTFTISNAILDLISDPKHAELIKAAREEVTRVLADHGGKWTRPAVSQLFLLDSIVRESMRFSGIISHGLVRKVVAPEGLMFKGTNLPKGTIVAIAASNIHHDTSIYGKERFDAFRFANERRNLAAEPTTPPPTTTSDNDNNSKHIESKNLSLISTSGQHLAFGHGRHACPGRFFAANEMKLALAYILLNYDIEPLKERPANMWVHDVAIPPPINLRIRRKKGTF